MSDEKVNSDPYTLLIESHGRTMIIELGSLGGQDRERGVLCLYCIWSSLKSEQQRVVDGKESSPANSQSSVFIILISLTSNPWPLLFTFHFHIYLSLMFHTQFFKHSNSYSR